MATFIRHSELDPVNISSARLKPLLDEDEEGDSSEEENAETVPEKGTEESTTV